jgi:hypothetical protein
MSLTGAGVGVGARPQRPLPLTDWLAPLLKFLRKICKGLSILK